MINSERSKETMIRYIIASITLLLSVGCSRQSERLPEYVNEARKSNTSLPQFLKQERGSENLVVFVHGVFGDTLGTWRNTNGLSLPKALLSLPEFSTGYDVFMFGFPSSKIESGSFRISEAAKALKTEWDFRGFAKYKSVLVVAHSMGGLVVLEALTTFHDMRNNVPLVFTYATPYNGAQISKLANDVLNNKALADMIPRDDSGSFLLSLGNRWKQARSSDKRPTRVECGYEKAAIPVIGLIVAESSATGLCDSAADAIPGNHIELVKPDTVEHQSIKVLVNAIRATRVSGQVQTQTEVKTQQSKSSEDSRPDFSLKFDKPGIIRVVPSVAGMKVEDLELDAFGKMLVSAKNDVCKGKAAGSEWPLYEVATRVPDRSNGDLLHLDSAILATAPSMLLDEVRRSLGLPDNCLEADSASLWLHLSFRNEHGVQLSRYYRIDAAVGLARSTGPANFVASPATRKDFDQEKSRVAYDFLKKPGILESPFELRGLAMRTSTTK